MKITKKAGKQIFEELIRKFLVFCGVLYVLIPTNPLNMAMTYRDSGVFLYIGWRILNNELPYRDLWDHKPPVVYYLNALGLTFFEHSRWGVWLIELVLLSVSAFIGYSLVKKLFGNLPALFGSVLWLVSLAFVFRGGNLTEEYALPMQFATLWLIKDIDQPDFSPRCYILIGLLGMLAFLTKQTTIGLWLAIILFLLIQRFYSHQIKRFFYEILLIIAGSLTLAIPTMVYFWVQNSISQFFSNVFVYNFLYSSIITGFSNHITPLIIMIKFFSLTGIFPVAIIGYVSAVMIIFFKRQVVGKWFPFFLICLIDLPIELFLVSISGNSYEHYFISLLPSLFIFVGFTYLVINSQLSPFSMRKIGEFLYIFTIISCTFLVTYNLYPVLVNAYNEITGESAVSFIKSNTEPDDFVLMWGAESSINYFSQRRSPTQFIYQYPLYLTSYADSLMVEGFLDDIIKNHPKYIFDTKNDQTPFLSFPIDSININSDIKYIKSHYRYVQDIDLWAVYEYIDE